MIISYKKMYKKIPQVYFNRLMLNNSILFILVWSNSERRATFLVSLRFISHKESLLSASDASVKSENDIVLVVIFMLVYRTCHWLTETNRGAVRCHAFVRTHLEILGENCSPIVFCLPWARSESLPTTVRRETIAF